MDNMLIDASVRGQLNKLNQSLKLTLSLRGVLDEAISSKDKIASAALAMTGKEKLCHEHITIG